MNVQKPGQTYWFVILIRLAITMLPLAASAQATVELRPQVRIVHPYVLLGDIAIITTHDLATLRELAAVPLGGAPAANVPVSLERNLIEQWVSHRLKSLPGDAIAWRGAKRVELMTLPTEVSGEMIQQVAREAVLAWLKPRADKVDVVELGQARNLAVPQGVLNLRVRPLPDTLAPAKRMTVWVDVLVDEQFVKSVPISFQISAFRLGWVSKESIDASGLISLSAVEKREIDVASLKPGSTLTRDLDKDPLRLKHAVAPGTPIVKSNTEKIPAVARGERIKLQAYAGEVVLESPAEVLQDGYIGQIIRVRAPTADRPMLVRVTGIGRVEIME